LYLDKNLESFIKKYFKEFKAFEVVEDAVAFINNILNPDKIIVWFEDKNSNRFWSSINNTQIFLEKGFIEHILKNQDSQFVDRENDLKTILNIRKLAHHSQDAIHNVMFHKIFCNNYRGFIIIEILNISNENLNFKDNLQNLLKTISLFITQNIKMKDILKVTNYFFEEQKRAFAKQTKIIQNDLEHSNILDVNIFYKPSDILNGDSYSIHKTQMGDIFVYIIDAMGHGIASSLTAYSISAVIQNRIRNSNSFSDLMNNLLDNIQYILTDEEQLTCGLFWFSQDFSKVEYVVAGMYAPMILDGDEVILAKANNIPFMNFAFDVDITTIELKNFKKFLIFTDGLVEDTQDLKIELEKLLKDDSYTEDIFKKLSVIDLEDDTTIIKLSKREQ